MSKYKILPVKKDEEIKQEWRYTPKFLPIHPFCMLMNAPPKSGKSNLLVNILMNCSFDYVHKFKNIYWISPTVRSDKTTQPIMNILNDETDNDIKDIIKIFTDDDLDDMNSLIRAIIEHQVDEKDPTLIIMDDCIGKMKNGEFGKLCAKYRHFNLSIICISQSFKSFDTISRNSASHYILFKTYNEKEEEKMIEELNGFPNIKKYYNDATQEKYNFLYINVEEQLIMHNFDKILWERNQNQYCECKGEKQCGKPIKPEKKNDDIIIYGSSTNRIRTTRKKEKK